MDARSAGWPVCHRVVDGKYFRVGVIGKCKAALEPACSLMRLRVKKHTHVEATLGYARHALTPRATNT